MTRKLLLLFVLVLTACSPVATKPPNSAPGVVASTTFLADIAQNVAGDRLQVDSLLPVGADPHSYQPIPQDVVRIADSDLLIVNGAGYEQFLGNLLENAGGERMMIEASAGLKAVTEAHGEEVELDPHFWIDPNNVVVYVENIRDGLSQIDPEGVDTFNANAEAYIDQLRGLDLWIDGQVTFIPVERRLLVTNHDSLGYFAKRYGFTIIGTVVEGTSSNAAPSAQQMAALIDQIKASGAPAVFLDAAESPSLARQIASDAGVSVVNDLYFGSLTDGPPAESYLDMMKHNITRIVEALK